MAQNTSISLDDHFVDFLSREVSSGRYRSASEVVRAGLAPSGLAISANSGMPVSTVVAY